MVPLVLWEWGSINLALNHQHKLCGAALKGGSAQKTQTSLISPCWFFVCVELSIKFLWSMLKTKVNYELRCRIKACNERCVCHLVCCSIAFRGCRIIVLTISCVQELLRRYKSSQISLLPYIHTWRYSVQQIWTPHIWQRGMKESLLICPSVIKILKIIYLPMMP